MKDFLSEDSEEAFAREYSRLVSRMVRPFFLKGGDYDDLYQEGMIGLLKAIRKYDPSRSDNFEAFAVLCIKTRIYDMVRASALMSEKERIALKHLEMMAEKSVEDILNNPETQCLANESEKEIKAVLNGLLSPFEASVLDPYLEGYTVNEIAACMSREAKSVDNAIGRIRRKLACYLSMGDSRLM